MYWRCCNAWLKPLQQPCRQTLPAGRRSNNPVAALVSSTCWFPTPKSLKKAGRTRLTKMWIKSRHPRRARARRSIPHSVAPRSPSSAKLWAACASHGSLGSSWHGAPCRTPSTNFHSSSLSEIRLLRSIFLPIHRQTYLFLGSENAEVIIVKMVLFMVSMSSYF